MTLFEILICVVYLIVAISATYAYVDTLHNASPVTCWLVSIIFGAIALPAWIGQLLVLTIFKNSDYAESRGE